MVKPLLRPGDGKKYWQDIGTAEQKKNAGDHPLGGREEFRHMSHEITSAGSGVMRQKRSKHAP